MTATMKVIVADDDPAFRAAMREAVTRVVVEAHIVEADSLDTLEPALLAHPDTDLILVASHGIDGRGLSALHLCARHPSIAIAIISDGATIVCHSLDLEAAGALSNPGSIDQIGSVLRTLHDGRLSRLQHQVGTPRDRSGEEREPSRKVSRLTGQQLRVLLSLADGLSNKTIADDLGVKEATIKAHMTVILRKLGLERRTQAALLAQRILRTRQPGLAEQATNADTFAVLGRAVESGDREMAESIERGKSAA